MVYNATLPLPEQGSEQNYLFLAGSIDYQTEHPWRKKIIKQFGHHWHFLDPTRLDHDDLTDQQMKQHIQWELDAMELADTILLHLLPNSKSPISLVELGLHMKSNKLTVVCASQFYQRRYIETICKKYKTPMFDTLQEASTFINDRTTHLYESIITDRRLQSRP